MNAGSGPRLSHRQSCLPLEFETRFVDPDAFDLRESSLPPIDRDQIRPPLPPRRESTNCRKRTPAKIPIYATALAPARPKRLESRYDVQRPRSADATDWRSPRR